LAVSLHFDIAHASGPHAGIVFARSSCIINVVALLIINCVLMFLGDLADAPVVARWQMNAT